MYNKYNAKKCRCASGHAHDSKKGQPKEGKVLEKECAYYADFCYTENGRYIVEDTKGMRTPDYKIKKKLMLYVHGIRITEI